MVAPVSLCLDTSWKKFRIKIDPTIRTPRNRHMIDEASSTLAPSRPPCITPQGYQADTDRKHTRVPQSPETTYSDQTVLMLAVRDRRDRAAFGLLFDYFAPRLKGVAMRSGLGSGAAEDVAQEVMLTVWRKSDQFDPHRAQVSAWIFQIARNRRIDLVRKENRPVPEEIKMADEVEDDASQIVAIEQEARHLKTALDRLSPDQRDLIEKAYLGELTHKEISDNTGLALGTVKSRIRLGLERLRHELRGMR
jgi:RNA polymerase sigma-70 factor (ECF subfamily)